MAQPNQLKVGSPPQAKIFRNYNGFGTWKQDSKAPGGGGGAARLLGAGGGTARFLGGWGRSSKVPGAGGGAERFLGVGYFDNFLQCSIYCTRYT